MLWAYKLEKPMRQSLRLILTISIFLTWLTNSLQAAPGQKPFNVIELENSGGFSGGATWLLDQDKNLSLIFANAHGGQNASHLLSRATDGFTVSEGQPFPSMSFQGASTSGLCWGYGWQEGAIVFAEANQNGEPNRVYLSDGGEIQEFHDLSLNAGDNYHCSFEDLNNDGTHQLLLFDLAGPSKVFGIGRNGLKDVSDKPFYPWTLGGTPQGSGITADFDVDGWPDLFISSPAGADVLYRNEGDGRFVEHKRTNCAFETGQGISSGAAWADIDKDGDPDLILAKLGGPTVVLENQDGCFIITDQPILAALTLQTWAVSAVDFDLDGDMDFATGNYDGSIQIFENKEATFHLAQEIEHPGYPATGTASSGISSADVDFDGDPDIAVAIWDDRNNLILRNNLKAEDKGQALIVSVSNGDNQAAFNVSVVARTDNGQALYRHTSGSSSLRSQTVPVMTFGLDHGVKVDRLEIWFHGQIAAVCNRVSNTVRIDLTAEDKCQ